MHKRILFKDNYSEPKPHIISLSLTRFDTDFPSYMHSHKSTEVLFVTGGEGNLETINKSYSMKKGSLIFVNPNTLHTETQIKNEPSLCYYVLTLDNIKFFNKLSPKEKQSDVCYLNLSNEKFTEINSLFSKMFEEIDSKKLYSSDLTYSYFVIFMSIVVREYQVSTLYCNDETIKYSPFVNYAKNYIDCYYNIDFNMKELANKVCISYSSLYHKFVKEIGVAPIEYKLSKQIEEAKSMLITSDFSINQISSQSGFNNLPYFIQIFKRKTGTTPTEYRKNNKLTIKN